MPYNNFMPEVIPFCIGKFMPGNVYNFDACEFYGVRGAYGTHTNKNFAKPSIHRFNNCTLQM